MSGAKGMRERFHFMDGLRGFSIALLILHHAFSANIVAFLERMHLPVTGYFLSQVTGSCVSLFFVQSGIVLLRPYLRNERKFDIKKYFKRRFLRIYPTYFTAVVFGSFVVWFNTRYPTWYNLRGMRTVFTWPETFKELGIISFTEVFYNLAWWSLGLEMVFYILAPIIVSIFPKPEKITARGVAITLATTLIVTVVLQQLFTVYFPDFYTTTKIALPDGRMVPFARQTVWRFIDYPTCFTVGLLLAAKDFKPKVGLTFVAVGATIVILSLYYWFIVHAGFGLIYGGIIILMQNKVKIRKIVDTPFLVWVGERSYSLFLTHLSVFYLVNNIVSRFTTERNLAYAILTRGIGIPLSVFVAMLLFQFVERFQAKGVVTAQYFWPWQAKRLKHDLAEEVVKLEVKEEAHQQPILNNV